MGQSPIHALVIPNKNKKDNLLLMTMNRVNLTLSCYFNSMAMELLGFILLTVFQCQNHRQQIGVQGRKYIYLRILKLTGNKELSVPDMIFKRQERLEELKIEFSFVPEQKRITVRLRRIFATTLTLRPVTTFFSTRPKEDTSETSWALSIATSVSEKNEKWTSKNTFSALRAFHET